MKTIEKFFLKRDGHKQTYDRGKLAVVAVSLSLFLIGGSVLFVDFVTVPDTSVLSIRGVEATASPPPLPPAARALNSVNLISDRNILIKIIVPTLPRVAVCTAGEVRTIVGDGREYFAETGDVRCFIGAELCYS